jgi:hypothetical protein
MENTEMVSSIDEKLKRYIREDREWRLISYTMIRYGISVCRDPWRHWSKKKTITIQQGVASQYSVTERKHYEKADRSSRYSCARYGWKAVSKTRIRMLCRRVFNAEPIFVED